MAPTSTPVQWSSDQPPFPGHDAWFGSEMWRAHLSGHGDIWAPQVDDACPACQTKFMTAEIHKAIFSDSLGREQANRAATLAWSLQDGFGPGFDGQWDWSGIRDSSPLATAQMYGALLAEGLLS